MDTIETQNLALPKEITQHFEVLKTLKAEYQAAVIEENLLKKRDTPLEEYKNSFEVQFNKFNTSLIDVLKKESGAERHTTIVSLITYFNSNKENNFFIEEEAKNPEMFLNTILHTINIVFPASSTKIEDVNAVKTELNLRANSAATPKE